MSSSTGATSSGPQDLPRSVTDTQGDESTRGLEGRPNWGQICLTAFSGAVGLGSATGSYYFGLNEERDKHPPSLVIGYTEHPAEMILDFQAAQLMTFGYFNRSAYFIEANKGRLHRLPILFITDLSIIVSTTWAKHRAIWRLTAASSVMLMIWASHEYDDPPFLFVMPLCITGGFLAALFTNEFLMQLGSGVSDFIISVSRAGLDLGNAVAGALLACLGVSNPRTAQQNPTATDNRRD